MPLFDTPVRIGKETDKKIAKKSKTTQNKSRTSTVTTLSLIHQQVEKILGKYRNDYEIINTKEPFEKYITECIKNNEVAIDTETTGLDPISDKIVGISLYTPNNKAVYIPINHEVNTNIKQLTIEVIKPLLDKLVNTNIIMFNAKFDIRVIWNQIGTKLKCYFDCYLASRCLNENEIEGSRGLKALHQKYVLNNSEDAFSFDELFKNISFDKIEPEYAYLYGAHDAIITYELYKFQKSFLDLNHEREDLRNVAKVFWEIEMPCIEPVVELEQNGVCFDNDYRNTLSIQYNQLLKEKEEKFYRLCDDFGYALDEYRATKGDSNKLQYPINISSPSQLAIMLYDVLKIPPVDAKYPRGTGDEILQKIKHPIAEAIVEYREIKKLLTTYIDKLPECVNSITGRIHCNYNQYGADTGRFSSSSPNLQNIPSHNTEIRKMFTSMEGNVMLSSDYSSQEPKCLAVFCKRMGDSQLYDTFMQGKDLYSEIASKAFNKSYEECLEFNFDGTTNKEGKQRRTQAKSVLLGVLYGRGVNSIAEQLKCTKEKAQEIKDSVFRAFPAISKFEKCSKEMAQELGYVTTIYGRKRRLPNMQLPEYEFSWNGGAAPDNDVLDFDNNTITEVPIETKKYYINKLHSVKFWKKKDIIEEALAEGIVIKDNGGRIAQSERQCVNARIQGSAADLTKAALIALNNNQRMKELGFKILIPVHDEIIGECPIENAKECSQLLSSIMSTAAEEILEMPIKTDVTISKCWYGEEVKV